MERRRIFFFACEQGSDSGTQFLNPLTKEDNLKNYSEQFKNLIGSAIKTSEKTINNLIETYNKEAQFTQKASEELLSSITKQFDAVAEMNTKLFNDSLKHFEQAKKSAEGKTNKTK